jgi:hypothetical protein
MKAAPLFGDRIELFAVLGFWRRSVDTWED